MTNIERDGIYGYIDYELKGKNIRLHGQIIGINESDSTAKMRFDNGVERNGIPNEAINLDEGVKDSLMRGVKKFGDWVSKKFKIVGGFARTLWNGIVVPGVNSVMIGQFAQKGLLPSAVGFYPSQETEEEAEEAGVAISSQEAELDEDNTDINQFWRDIVDKVQGANESKETITMNAIKEAYLEKVKTLENGEKMANMLNLDEGFHKFFNGPFDLYGYIGYDTVKKIFEGAYEEGDAPAGLNSYASENIPEMNQAEIVKMVMMQLQLAFNHGEFDWNNKDMVNTVFRSKYKEFKAVYANTMKNATKDVIAAAAKKRAIAEVKNMKKIGNIGATKPLMIWGAPGIGKTSIIQQTRSAFSELTHGEHNVNMLEVVLSKMEHDDFGLPSLSNAEGEEGGRRAQDAPQSWLPIWKMTGDPEEDARRDAAANYMGNYKSNFDFDKSKGVTLTNDRFGSIGANAPSTPNETSTVDNGIPADIPPTFRPKGFKVSKITGETYVYDKDGNVRPTPVKHRKPKDDVKVPNESYKYNFFRLLNESEEDDLDFDTEVEAEESAKKDIITDGGILFFDELTRAKKGVMNVIMNLINDRKYGEGWVLGSHWIIVCAGNRFYEMTGMESTWEKAFGTRFIQMTFVPDFNDWLKWAQGYNIDPTTGHFGSIKGPQRIDQDILDFLTYAKSKSSGGGAWYEDIDDEGTDQDKAAKIYANPRSWQTASNAIYQAAIKANGAEGATSTTLDDKTYYNLPLEQKLKILQTTIGRGIASYQAFAKFHDSKKFFTPKMIESIWTNGTITGKPSTGKQNLGDLLPKDQKTGKRAGMDDPTLMELIDEVLIKPGSKEWVDVTSQDLVNMFSYFISIVRLRHGDMKIINPYLVNQVGKKIVASGADKANGFTWGVLEKKYFLFIAPIVGLIKNFEGSFDASKKEYTMEEVQDYADKYFGKGDNIEETLTDIDA